MSELNKLITIKGDTGPKIPETPIDYSDISRQMRINADILMKEITEHANKEIDRINNERKI